MLVDIQSPETGYQVPEGNSWCQTGLKATSRVWISKSSHCHRDTCKILPNACGPKHYRRLLSAGVVWFILMHALPMWVEVTLREGSKWIGFTSWWYWFTALLEPHSDETVLVVASLVPADILAKNIIIITRRIKGHTERRNTEYSQSNLICDNANRTNLSMVGRRIGSIPRLRYQSERPKFT